ncbi:MAG: DUF6134 family protein [Myxococcota bacterium]|nr:DUF6134 family protein [Myxococcota bacterium]
MLLLLAATASAETLQLDYTLRAQGLQVGTRSLKVSYLPSADGSEDRLLECYTELPAADFSQRVSGLSADSLVPGFSARNAQGGELWEVQAARSQQGLNVSFSDARGLQASTLDFSQVNATTLSLMDPGRSLQGQTQLELLSAETGQVLNGPLQQLDPETLEIGGQPIAAQHYLWSPSSGPVHLYYADSGVLLRSTLTLAGQTLELSLDAPPPARTLDTQLLLGPDVQEESL